NHLAAASGDPARGRRVAEEGLDLRASGARHLVRRVHRRLGRAMAAVPLGEQRGGGIEVDRCEGPNLEGATATGHGGESYRAERLRQMIDGRFRRAYSPSIPTPVRERTCLRV